METPKETSKFVQRVHELFQDLKICNGNLEEGAMRIDVNVNLVNEETGSPLTPLVEIKNINGIGVIEAALIAEIKRQEHNLKTRTLSNESKQETRFYSPETDETVLLRVKDSSESYRYLPEYDLPVYNTKDFEGNDGDSDLPLTRHDIIENYQKSYPQLKEMDLLRLWTRPETLPPLFSHCLPLVQDQRFLLNWCVGELLAILNRENLEHVNFSPRNLAHLVDQVKNGILDKESAKMELAAAIKEERDLLVMKEEHDTKFNDVKNELIKEINSLFILHSDRVAFLRSPEGQKRGSIDFFIGPLLKKFRGRITVNHVTTLLKETLSMSITNQNE